MKLDKCQMITIESLDPRDEEVERNPQSMEELEIEEVKLLREANPRIMKVRKNMMSDFKCKLIMLLKIYHECFTKNIMNVCLDHG